MGSRPAWLALAFALLCTFALAVWPSAASAAPAPSASQNVASPLRADPVALELRPGHVRARLRLRNTGDTPIQLGRLTVQGRDWGSFRITDAHNPELVPAQGFVELNLEVDPRSFASRDEAGALLSYRSGRAKLQVYATDHPTLSVPLRFAPRPSQGWSERTWAPWIRLGGLLLLGAWLIRLRRPQLRQHTSASVLWVGGLCLALGSMVWTEGLCPTQLDMAVGLLGQSQCARLGGSATLLDLPLNGLGMLLGWAAIGTANLWCAPRQQRAGQARALASEIALLSIVFASLAIELGELHVQHLIDSQAEPASGWRAVLGPWMLVRNPAASAALLICLTRPRAQRIETITLCFWAGALCLGGWRMGMDDGWAPHALTWSLGWIVSLAKASLLLRLAAKPPAKPMTSPQAGSSFPAGADASASLADDPIRSRWQSWAWPCACLGLFWAVLS